MKMRVSTAAEQSYCVLLDGNGKKGRGPKGNVTFAWTNNQIYISVIARRERKE